MLSGLTMDDYQLSLTPVVERAEQLSSRREVVYRRPDGTIERTTMGACIERGRRLAGALKNLGVGDGDRVASLMWNQPEHLEMYFSVPRYLSHPVLIRRMSPAISWTPAFDSCTLMSLSVM